MTSCECDEFEPEKYIVLCYADKIYIYDCSLSATNQLTSTLNSTSQNSNNDNPH
jgi:hypothetical protein